MFFYNKNIKFKSEILDEFLFDNSVRIRVSTIFPLEKIEDMYFVRVKKIRKIFYYIQEIGIKNTINKIISRFREKLRNEKYFSIGLGVVVDSKSMKFSVGNKVVFLAYNHPVFLERIVIHENATFLFNFIEKVDFSKAMINNAEFFNDDVWWEGLLGWSPYSGVDFPPINQSAVLEKIYKFLSIKKESDVFPLVNTLQFEKKMISNQKKFSKFERKNAVLFGYGNYAKTVILPYLERGVCVKKIHEIDPLQLLPMKKNIAYDTSPYPRSDEFYDAYFIAGFHHTHVDIAIHGLKQGADVVIEKPLATTRESLTRLAQAMENSTGKVYACFQRRYHAFNNLFFQDFNIVKGDPISYYAIVYEENLPKLHWYRWPNSRSCIVSNACHWIDHFLFLNNYSAVVSFFSRRSAVGEVIVFVELNNKATLSLTLSHLGSSRIGVQDYIELRTKTGVASIKNGGNYRSENSSKILRTTKINKFHVYKKMYGDISKELLGADDQKILCEKREILYSSTALILDLEEMLLE